MPRTPSKEATLARVLKAIQEARDPWNRADQDTIARHAGIHIGHVRHYVGLAVHQGLLGVDHTTRPHTYRLTPEAEAIIAERWPRHDRPPLAVVR